MKLYSSSRSLIADTYSVIHGSSQKGLDEPRRVACCPIYAVGSSGFVRTAILPNDFLLPRYFKRPARTTFTNEYVPIWQKLTA